MPDKISRPLDEYGERISKLEQGLAEIRGELKLNTKLTLIILTLLSGIIVSFITVAIPLYK